MNLDQINREVEKINKKVDAKFKELGKLQQKSNKVDFSKMINNPTQEDLKLAGEVKKKFAQYMKTNDFVGAQKYLNHVKNELSSTNR